MFYEKFEAYLPKILLKKLPKIEANFTNLEVWCSKTELPKIEITNIEGYQYRGIPVQYNNKKCSLEGCAWAGAALKGMQENSKNAKRV